MLPVQDHLFLISTPYLATFLQHNSPFHSVVTSPSGNRNMKQTLQSRFVHRISLHLTNGILPLTDFGITKSLHTRAVTISKSLFSHNHFFPNASPQIDPEEASLPRPYRNILSQLRYFFFCSSPHSYREKIGLAPSPLPVD